MRSLSLKLSLLFAVIALVSVGVTAFWVSHSVGIEFRHYYEETWERDALPGSPQMGMTEEEFIDAYTDSLKRIALAAVLGAVILGLVFSRLITGPMRRLTLSAKRIADGDFSQRVPQKTRDEVGQLSSAFNSMAEQLDKKEQSRRQLLADVAHELRTPLTIIQGNMEAWLDGVTTPTPEQIASVHDETLLLSRLVTDLRDLSLAEAGQLRLHAVPTNLADLTNAEIESIESRFQEQQISLHRDLPPDLPPVSIDSERIRQVLRNLLDNALRYTPAGGTIRVGATSTPPGWVTLCVSDTGSGIHPEDLPHIFDHFYKTDRSRHRGYGGSGIGLAIVRQLVEAHGGKVWVESQPGEGSSFFFTLPSI